MEDWVSSSFFSHQKNHKSLLQQFATCSSIVPGSTEDDGKGNKAIPLSASFVTSFHFRTCKGCSLNIHGTLSLANVYNIVFSEHLWQLRFNWRFSRNIPVLWFTSNTAKLQLCKMQVRVCVVFITFVRQELEFAIATETIKKYSLFCAQQAIDISLFTY